MTKNNYIVVFNSSGWNKNDKDHHVKRKPSGNIVYVVVPYLVSAVSLFPVTSPPLPL